MRTMLLCRGADFALFLFHGAKVDRGARVEIEAQLAGKTLQEHFREQAELIDSRFAVRDARWDNRFQVIERDISTVRADVRTLKKDMVIVKEGIAILLKRS